ncbi:hypothetical protein MKW98_012908 [Papaver atlanticum]|uniref:Uncharacterized protein n=1 Tax=Papaver atlanticum TaxID=357466 RepID=A0AAD4SJM3_9MAGN|nr:hypothetical protein MKW98_012908 [Papaver atlanticum]
MPPSSSSQNFRPGFSSAGGGQKKESFLSLLEEGLHQWKSFESGAQSSNFHSPTPYHSHGGGGGGSELSGGARFRPMGGDASSFNGGGSHGMPGQKRGFPISSRGGSSPDNTGGAAFAKHFIGLKSENIVAKTIGAIWTSKDYPLPGVVSQGPC